MHNSPTACTYFILQRNKQGELAVSDTARRDKQIKLLEEAIQAIAQHPTPGHECQEPRHSALENGAHAAS